MQVCKCILRSISWSTRLKSTIRRQENVCDSSNWLCFMHLIGIFFFPTIIGDDFCVWYIKVIRWTQPIIERLWLRPEKMSLKEQIFYWLVTFNFLIFNNDVTFGTTCYAEVFIWIVGKTRSALFRHHPASTRKLLFANCCISGSLNFMSSWFIVTLLEHMFLNMVSFIPPNSTIFPLISKTNNTKWRLQKQTTHFPSIALFLWGVLSLCSLKNVILHKI